MVAHPFLQRWCVHAAARLPASLLAAITHTEVNFRDFRTY